MTRRMTLDERHAHTGEGGNMSFPNYDSLIRWMFLQEQGIDPEMPYNDGRPYGDYEWEIDHDLAYRAHEVDARSVLNTFLGDKPLYRKCEHGCLGEHTIFNLSSTGANDSDGWCGGGILVWPKDDS